MSFQTAYPQPHQDHYPHYHPYQDSQINEHAYVGYGLSDAQRSKTPTSLINHTGFSPGPLSTPPQSRNPSQGPPELLSEQVPEQMVYDETFSSLSNSPTSVRTPDHDAFEVDLLDSPLRDFYNDQNAIMNSTQGTTMPIMAYSYNEQDTMHTAYPPQSQHFNTQTQFTLQPRSLQTGLLPQSNQTYYGNQYTNQPSRQDPWSGEGPFRNPEIPRSSVALFAPESDPMAPRIDVTAFPQISDIDSWTSNNTDPNYLLSPNDPAVPPNDFFPFMANRQYPPQPHSHSNYQMQNQMHLGRRDSPPELSVTTVPSTPDAQRYASYEQSSPLFTEQYTTGNHSQLPALRTSIEPSHSPLVSASSIAGSDGMVSPYQQSPSSMMMLEPHHSSQRENRFVPRTSIEMERSPTRSIPEVTFEISPEPEGHMVGPTRRTRDKDRGTQNGRPGGRALGTHLEPRVAKAAHDMRKTGSCWHCVLQRDKCGPGETCDRCFKRSQRPNADCGLGCSRIRLSELSSYFLPSIVMQIHEDTNLTRFVSQFISQWTNREITVYMTCSQKNMPRIAVQVYEFLPLGQELLEQIQYRTDPATQQRITVKKQSPPLGMLHINHNEEKKYDRYINDIVDYHLDGFAEICWAEDDNDFAPRLFKLMTRVKPKGEDEAKLLREVNRLIVTTYIMSHTITIAEETKFQTLQKLHSYVSPDTYAQSFTSPRMTNRQLKYFFAKLQRTILSNVLNKLQQIFKSSKGCDKWVAAFVSVVGMCMAHEDQQKTTHQVMATRAATENMDMRDAQTQAEFACREIDQRMNFISQIFRWKYNRKCNPLKDPDHAWEKEVGFGDESSASFVRSVAQLVKENTDYLQQRQGISISTSNQGKYTARLISQFMLSFWLPQ